MPGTTRSRTPRTTPNGSKAIHGVVLDVDFDLDALEDEATERPFTFRLGGQTYTMTNPQAVDWQTSYATAIPGAGQIQATKDMLRDMLGADYDLFAKHRLSGTKLQALLTRCAEHYGLALPQ